MFDLQHAKRKKGTDLGVYKNKGSRLFLVRVWEEEVDGGSTEWHGRVQPVAGSEAHSFSDWPGLVEALQAMCSSGTPTEKHEGQAAKGDGATSNF